MSRAGGDGRLQGSFDDVQHVLAGSRVVQRIAGELGPRVKLLFVLPPVHSSPPSTRVRESILRAIGRLGGQLSRVAVVVTGSGFGAAMHRGAITGLTAIFRPKLGVRVARTVREALLFLMEDAPDAVEALAPQCERRLPAAEGSAG